MAGLAAYLEACDAEADLSELGVMAVDGAVTGALVNRLRVVDHHRQHPELRRAAGRGAGRRGRAVPGRHHAAVQPARPRPGQPGAAALGVRRLGAAADAGRDAEPGRGSRPRRSGSTCSPRSTPASRRSTTRTRTSPTECIAVLGQAFQSISWEALANVPSYAAWWRGSDMTAGYRYHRSVLQVLQSNGCAGPVDAQEPRPCPGARRAHRGLPRRPARRAAPRPGRC